MLNKLGLLAGLPLAFATSVASAQDFYPNEPSEPGPYSYGWHEPRLMTGIGIGLQLGGGVAGFTSSTMRDTINSQVSGLWSARATFGTHIPLAIEAAYNGTAVQIQPLGQATTGTLLGTNIEGALRWNILPHNEFNPYVFAGAGWQRYDVTHAQFSVASTGLQDHDNLAVFPMGVGFSYRDPNGFVFDARGTFHAAQSSSLLEDPAGGHASLHTWDASGTLGYEF